MQQELNSNFKRLVLLTKLNFKIIFKRVSFWIISSIFLLINFIFLLISVISTYGIYPGLDDVALYKFLGFIFSTFSFSILVIFISHFYYRTQINEDVFFIETRSGIKLRDSFLMRYISCLIILFLVSTINLLITLIFISISRLNIEYKWSIYLSWALFYYLYSIVAFTVVQLCIVLFKQIEGMILSFISILVFSVSPALSMIITFPNSRNTDIRHSFDEHLDYLYRIQASKRFYEDVYSDELLQKYFSYEDLMKFYADYLAQKNFNPGSIKNYYIRSLFQGQVNYYIKSSLMKNLKITELYNDLFNLIDEKTPPPKNKGKGFESEYAWLFLRGNGQKTASYYAEMDISYILDFISKERPEYKKLMNYIEEAYNNVNQSIVYNHILQRNSDKHVFEYRYSDHDKFLLCFNGKNCENKDKELNLNDEWLEKVSKVYYNYPELLIINWIITQSWINLYDLVLENFEGRYGGLFRFGINAYNYNEDLDYSFKMNSALMFSHFFSMYMTLPGNNITNDKFSLYGIGSILLPTIGLDKEVSKQIVSIYEKNREEIKKVENGQKLNPIFSEENNLTIKYRTQLNKFVMGLLYVIGFILLSVGTYFIFRNKLRP